ncbi:uncharacterized protein LOC113308622 isoform X2 [Papaver somniferum]|uniref:uncharacterized protein LOC113308622 isoform X2 n=1 Tax=Papaver somniferum TaxID=3469 RepID=UPI000E6F644A|nr:uncharacterized protein LOC113308622 isoform X2 [Papaver somniferum]
MDRRKSRPEKVTVESGGNGIYRYIHPPEFRNKHVQLNNYSSLLLLAEIRKWLSVDEKAIFKGTAIGHLLSVPEDSKFSGTIVHFLLSREIDMDDKPDEMHFKVGGKLLHFGKREFALITGLSFKKPKKAFVYSTDPSSLMRTHFPNQNHVSASKVKALLFKKNSTCPSLDRVKFALLLVVHNFLMSCQDADPIKNDYWYVVDNLEEFNKYPWGEVTFDRIKKWRLRTRLHYHANKEISGAGRKPAYKVVGIPHALMVWALDIMPGLLNLCGRKIESKGWQPHMLCVLCTKSPPYPHIIGALEDSDVHVRSDIMWQKGDGNQLIMLGLEEGTYESSSFMRIEEERQEYHGEDYSPRVSFHEREDGNQGHEVPETAPVFPSKKRKMSTKKPVPYKGTGIGNYEPEHFLSSEPITIPAIPILHTSVKHSHDKDVPIGNMSSSSGAETRGIESLEVGELVEVSADATMKTSSSKGLATDSTLLNILASIDVFPSPPGFASTSSQEIVEGFEYVDNFKIPEEHVILYKKIYEKHGHMATKKVIKFNDAMLITCVTSLLKIISAMENVRGSEFSEALLERWEGFIQDAEALEFNIKWLREGLNRLRNHWRSSFEIDKEVESHSQVLDAMQVKYVHLSTREDKLNAELSEVKIQKREAEVTISSEREAIQEKVTEKNKFRCEPVLGSVLSLNT